MGGNVLYFDNWLGRVRVVISGGQGGERILLSTDPVASQIK